MPSASVSGASHVLRNRMREYRVAFLVFLAQRGYVLRQHLRLELGRDLLAERLEFCRCLCERDPGRQGAQMLGGFDLALLVLLGERLGVNGCRLVARFHSGLLVSEQSHKGRAERVESWIGEASS